MWNPGKLPSNFLLMLTLARQQLSADERSLVRLLALGCRPRQIAVITDRPLSEVRKLRRVVMRKTGSRNLAMLRRYARTEGIMSEGDALTEEERRGIARV